MLDYGSVTSIIIIIFVVDTSVIDRSVGGRVARVLEWATSSVVVSTSIYPSINLFSHPSISLLTHLPSIHLSTYSSFHPSSYLLISHSSIYLPTHLPSTYLIISHPSIYLPTHLPFIHLSTYSSSIHPSIFLLIFPPTPPSHTYLGLLTGVLEGMLRHNLHSHRPSGILLRPSQYVW